MGNCARPATHDEPPADYQDGANQQTSGGFGNTDQAAYTGEQQAAYATGPGPYDPGMAVDQQVVSGGYEVQQPSYGMDGNTGVPMANFGMQQPPVMPGPSYPGAGGDGGAPPVSGGMGGGGDGQTYATYEEAQAAADAANAQAGAGSYGGPSNYQPAYQGPGPDPQPQPDYPQYPSGPSGPMMGAPGPMMTGAPGPMMSGAPGPMMGAPLPRGQTVDDAPVVQSSGAMAASGGMPVGGGDVVVSGGLPAGNAYPDPMPQPAYDSQPQPSGGYPTADAPEMPTAGGAAYGATVMPAGYDGGVVTGYPTGGPQGQMMPPASGVMPPASGVSPPVQAVY